MAAFLGFLCLLALVAQAWSRLSVRQLEYALELPSAGLFPGQQISLKRRIHNGKLLPLVWLELLEEADEADCLVPDERFLAAHPEASANDSAPRQCALYRFPLLKWHQTLYFEDQWQAKRRGIHVFKQALMRSGDGFGLASRQLKYAHQPMRYLAVYPALRPVNFDLLLRDIWDSYSSAYGYLEDQSLLRSVRDYLPQDPARRINQRQLARGAGLKTNQYEVVTPDAVAFVLDARSFAGAPAADFEQVLSIIASLLVGLNRRRIRVNLVTPRSAYFGESSLAAGEGQIGPLLTRLAAASSQDAPLAGPLAAINMGQTYYICHSLAKAGSLPLLAGLPPHKTRLLVYQPAGEAAVAWQTRHIGSLEKVS